MKKLVYGILFCSLLLPQAVLAAKNIWIDDRGEVRSETDVPAGERKVELFVTSWCPYCKQAIRFLRSRGVSFTVYDIEKDRKALLRRKKLEKRSGVPLAVINGRTILGFSEEAYIRALEEK